MKRGRKSTAELSVVVPLNEGRRRLDPPASLSKAEASIFRELCLSVPPGHFAPCDVPLIAAYAGAVAMNRDALRSLQRNPDKVVLSMWEKSARMITTISTKLRLTPQSRLHKITTARAMNNFQPSGTEAIRQWLDDSERNDE